MDNSVDEQYTKQSQLNDPEFLDFNESSIESAVLFKVS